MTSLKGRTRKHVTGRTRKHVTGRTRKHVTGRTRKHVTAAIGGKEKCLSVPSSQTTRVSAHDFVLFLECLDQACAATITPMRLLTNVLRGCSCSRSDTTHCIDLLTIKIALGAAHKCAVLLKQPHNS
ncbi:hypothetical protein NDU88_003277 [Pleurodeles waltl]|uniref:Uncharacterized protein n=1 Tax=Pleurodeles waltl TaxID=8319 RepID=A0AAV7MV52_PLEWA|nr:hypothetical protein NDU88_003277 [Pleurodeles waltl]